MRKSDSSSKREVVKMATLISQISITVLTSIFMCVIIGLAIDYFFKVNTLIFFIILGVIASFKSVYVLLCRVGVLTKQDRSNNDKADGS